MFGTAVGDFSNYPELLESANSTYENMKSAFSKLANEDDEAIAFKCITLWSMIHGLVGILRKVQLVGDNYEEDIGPISTASLIANNLEVHLDKVVSEMIDDVLSENTGVRNKAKKTGMPYGILMKVYNRGMAAWRTGHRPGASQQQWAMARVNSFVTKSSGTWGKADSDLAAKVRAAGKD